MNGKMDDDDRGREQRRAFLRTFLGPELTDAGEEVAAAADFDIPRRDSGPWIEFIQWINSRPDFIGQWRTSPESERSHYLRFADAIADSRNAYAAVLYHIEKLEALETKIHNILSRYDFSRSLTTGSSVAIGQSRIADFEYHGFIFAYRRALDYLAWGLSTYFAAKVSSFRQLGERVGRWSPPAVAKALEHVYHRHETRFAFVMDKGRGKSTRDRLAHKNFVQAFVINISPTGFRLVGGGEALGMAAREDNASLTEVLKERAEHLHACVREMLDAFRLAVIEEEARRR